MHLIELVVMLVALGLAYATPAVYWWSEAPGGWPVWKPALQAAALGLVALAFGVRLGALFGIAVGVAMALAVAIAIGVGMKRGRRATPRV